MQRLWVFLFLLFAAVRCVAQNVGINSDGSSPNANAILDIKSGNKGLLIPRMDSFARKAIPDTKGMLVYDTTTGSFWYNSGTGWKGLPSGWSVTGNKGTQDGTDFIGTIDNAPFNIRVGGIPSGRIDAATGKGSVFWGLGCGFSSTGFGNSGFGSGAMLYVTTGGFNTGIGFNSLVTNATGNNNTGVGASSLYATTGYCNMGGGAFALYSNTTGSNNTAIGYQAMISNTTGSNNTVIGCQAGTTGNNLQNATAIGYQASVDASNKVRIGNSSVTVIEGAVPFTSVSDGRFKYNIRENIRGLDFICRLRPVTYQFDARRFDKFCQAKQPDLAGEPAYVREASYIASHDVRRTGFIAQEVEQTAEELGFTFNGVNKPATDKGYYTLSYELFVVPLVKAVQEQQILIETQSRKLEAMQQEIDELKRLVLHSK